MASIKVKFRPSSVAEREGSIYYQIIHERNVRHILSGYKLFPAEWDARRSMITTNAPAHRLAIITSIRHNIQCDISRLKRIIRKFEAEGLPFSINEIAEEYYHYTHRYTLFNFMQNIISTLHHNGNLRTAETYQSTLNSFRLFRHNQDIMLDAITAEIMDDYQAWLYQRGLVANTISFYARILRATYNRAVEDNIIKNQHPFRHVYTGIATTIKRALPLSIIRKIKALDLSKTPALDYARDIFLLSFYLRGMSFIDMAFLQKTDLKGGHIFYRRHKTGRLLIIEWTDQMLHIINKYPTPHTPYLLPIIQRHYANERAAYRNINYTINKNLKKIGAMIGLSIPLTLYVARHSWASAARDKGIPLSIISQGMGHNRETTTQIYLSGIHTSVIDKANFLILSSL